MEEPKKVHKEVTDLGAAAYLMMHKFSVIGRRGKGIWFEIGEEENEEFERKSLQYLNSEFHRFDSCLMSLKKIHEYMPPASR